MLVAPMVAPEVAPPKRGAFSGKRATFFQKRAGFWTKVATFSEPYIYSVGVCPLFVVELLVGATSGATIGVTCHKKTYLTIRWLSVGCAGCHLLCGFVGAQKEKRGMVFTFLQRLLYNSKKLCKFAAILQRSSNSLKDMWL